MTHEEAIVEMERMIMGWIQIPEVLPVQIGDLGCGVGGMTAFEEPLDVFLSQWAGAGLRITRIEEITFNVYPSAILISTHAQMRLKEQPDVEEDEHERRVGGAVLAELMGGFETGSNMIGYYIIQATKN